MKSSDDINVQETQSIGNKSDEEETFTTEEKLNPEEMNGDMKKSQTFSPNRNVNYGV